MQARLHNSLGNFVKIMSLFLDALFSVFYDWFWMAFAMFFGLLVIELRMPGLLEFLKPLYASMTVTIITGAFLLTMVKRGFEPLLMPFLRTKEKEEQAKEKQEIPA